jgi:hypothetical protein
MMNRTVCLSALTIEYPNGGGHHWVYLNWALGLKANGFDVVWLEPLWSIDETRGVPLLQSLKERLAPFGLEESVVIVDRDGKAPPGAIGDHCLGIDAALDSELMLNIWYEMPQMLVDSFRRSALLDIDPGLLQRWMQRRPDQFAPHDLYFTTGETVGSHPALYRDLGLIWHYVPPCVALEHWPVTRSPVGARYTTVSHWQMGEYEYDGDEIYSNDKRTGFLPFLDLPRQTDVPLELALYLADTDEPEAAEWRRRGWSIIDSQSVAASPFDYRNYVQSSRGEFSAVKPSCVRLQNAWISDRTLCYLASGKPAIIQDTGPSSILPESEGLLRFRTVEQAADVLQEVEENYDDHCRYARELAETYFDATRVAARLLEVGLS